MDVCSVFRGVSRHETQNTCRSVFKLLAPELFFLILAHPVYKI